MSQWSSSMSKWSSSMPKWSSSMSKWSSSMPKWSSSMSKWSSSTSKWSSSMSKGLLTSFVLSAKITQLEFSPSITSQKAVMQALSINDCPAEPYLFRVSSNVKKISEKRPCLICMETHGSHGRASMVYGCKTMMKRI